MDIDDFLLPSFGELVARGIIFRQTKGLWKAIFEPAGKKRGLESKPLSLLGLQQALLLILPVSVLNKDFMTRGYILQGFKGLVLIGG